MTTSTDRRRASETGTASERPRVSVVMRCKNSDWVIGQALAALYSQTFQDFELIVIDSGSTDTTLDLVREYPHRLIQIQPEEYYPGPVLNRGAEAARGDIVVLLNSDSVLLTPESLQQLVNAFDDSAVDAALGRQVPRPEAQSWVRREYAESFPATGETPPWITLSAPLAALRKSAWERHPFYRDAWGSEDTEWGQWAKDENITIRYVAGSLTMHSHNYTLRELKGRRFIEGEADAFIYGRKENLLRAVGRWAASSARDVVACARTGDWADVPRVPARRAVFHWAYLQGHRHGIERIATNNRDASVGQRTVLDRHHSATRGRAP
jgi:rhamnosyltransferase